MPNNSINAYQGIVGDPLFSNVSVLMHGQGTSGDTVFPEVKGHTFTRHGAPVLSNAQAKFPGTSMSFNGSSYVVAAPVGTEFQFGSGDFTIEFWFYQTARPGLSNVLSMCASGSGSGTIFQIKADGNLALSTYVTQYGNMGAGAVTLNAWNHIAISRTGGLTKVFLNGALYGQLQDNLNLTDNTFSLGATAVGDGPFTGYIQDVRVTKGTGRYSGPFTPPTLPYSDY